MQGSVKLVVDKIFSLDQIRCVTLLIKIRATPPLIFPGALPLQSRDCAPSQQRHCITVGWDLQGGA